MTQKKNYSRCFIILQQGNEGTSKETDKLPSGYVKLELKNDKCKISYYVQNLKKETLPYYMVLICNKKELKKSIEIGEMNIDEYGRADVAYDYLTDDIAGSHISFDNISGAAVVKSLNSNIIPIMSGFSGTAVTNWENFDMVRSSPKDNVTNTKEVSKDKSIFDKYEESIEKSKISSEDNVNSSSDSDLLNKKLPDNTAENNNVLRHEIDTSEFCDSGNKDNHLFLKLAEDFEEVNDFSNEIKRCKWYKVKVGSEEKLKDTTDYNKYTVFYYPMLSYYSYIKKCGYFMVGYKFDKDKKIKCIIYGLPGKKNREDQPFGGKSGFVTWLPAQRSSDEIEGNWVMFYDFKTSTVLIPQN